MGPEYAWQISERQSLMLSNELFANAAASFGEFRNLTSGEWKVLLAKDPSPSFKVGVENECETDVESGDEKNDLKHHLVLGLDL